MPLIQFLPLVTTVSLYYDTMTKKLALRQSTDLIKISPVYMHLCVSVCAHMCVYLFKCNFITCLDSCEHQDSPDTE